MVSLAGQIALIIGLLFALAQGVIPLWGIARRNPYALAAARPCALGQFFCILMAFTLLTIAFVQSDFAISYVAQNSHPTLPFLYRLTAVWGGHEGSILLWILILNIWTMAFTFCQKNNPNLPLVLAVLGLMSVSFLCFLLLTSNPFLSSIGIQTGHDLNPLLQDPGFVIHPPMLYMGYVGFSVAFAITLAALIKGELDTTWARVTRQFAIAAWCFLTFGIMLGSWWAYRVLGWGGFWFWDPVENASLLPWLSGTALIHVLVMTEKRGTAKAWSAFLALITFALSLLGTFLIRSGVLISAHTFANDPERGVFLLLLLAILVTAALAIYLSRLSVLTAKQSLSSSRELALLLNSVLLFIAMLTILLGTLYPLLLDALHLGVISVGAPYFNQVMKPLVIITLLFMLLAPFSTWRHRTLSRIKSFKLSSGMALAHTGFFVLMMGILLSSAFSIEREVKLKPGSEAAIGPYRFLFLDTNGITGSNYRGIRASFDVTKQGRHIVNLYPEKRIYTVRDMVMTKVDIHPSIFRDLYIALGEPLDQNSWSIRLYYKPFIRWIWGGGLLMIIGGIVGIRTSYRKAT